MGGWVGNLEGRTEVELVVEGADQEGHDDRAAEDDVGGKGVAATVFLGRG